MRTYTSLLVAAVLASALTGCMRRMVTSSPDNTAGPTEEPPNGMVELTVDSYYGDQTWNVIAGGNAVCTSPCTQWFRAWQGIELRARDGDQIYVPGLGSTSDAKRALVIAEGTCEGKHTNGIVWTSLGGMGVVTGIPFLAIGCSNTTERGGMCTAGLITSGVSAAVTALGLYLLIDGLPKAHVYPAVTEPGRQASQPSKPSLSVTPTGLAGRF